MRTAAKLRLDAEHGRVGAVGRPDVRRHSHPRNLVRLLKVPADRKAKRQGRVGQPASQPASQPDSGTIPNPFLGHYKALHLQLVVAPAVQCTAG